MTPYEFAAHIRYKTRTNDTTFTDVDIKALGEIRLDEMGRRLLEVDEDIFLIPHTCDLVADQREYPFPSDILARMKRVEAKLDETNWIKLDEIDLTEIQTPTDETNITYTFANLEGEAFFDIRRKSLYLFSGTITAVTEGLRLWCNTYPSAAIISDLASTTDMSVDPTTITHGLPRELHEILARGVIIDYKESREKPIPLTERELKYEVDLRLALQSLKRGNLDRDVIGHLPPATARWNNGANL